MILVTGPEPFLIHICGLGPFWMRRAMALGEEGDSEEGHMRARAMMPWSFQEVKSLPL